VKSGDVQIGTLAITLFPEGAGRCHNILAYWFRCARPIWWTPRIHTTSWEKGGAYSSCLFLISRQAFVALGILQLKSVMICVLNMAENRLK